MPAPLPYADLPARLLTLQAAAVAAYVRHAGHPNRVGASSAHRKLWGAAYEARAALAESNPATAQGLLPASGSSPLPHALPLVPAAVRWAVDESARNTVSLSVDVAGPVGVSVTAPGASTPLTPAPVVTLTPTRASTVFPAVADGLYRVTLTLGSTALAALLIPVSRAEFRLFREDSRALGFAFRSVVPAPSPTYRARLALLAGAEAAARTGQAALAASLLAAVRALPPAPTPPALYPFPRPCP
ncbi:MAG: hypothetical protein NVS3B25_07450 [Hymenobacter sp.]